MKTYNPEDIILNFKGVRIDGFASGTMVRVTRTTESFKTVVGGLGDVTRVKMLDRRGTIVFTLMKEAPINDYLSTCLVNDELLNTGKGVAELTNLNSTTLHFAQEAWIVKPPDDEYTSDGDSIEWTLECAELEMYNGGAVL